MYVCMANIHLHVDADKVNVLMLNVDLCTLLSGHLLGMYMNIFMCCEVTF